MRAIRHAGIVVSNMETALNFYCGLLGLKIEKKQEETGAYLDNMLALQSARVTTAKLSAAHGSTLLELLEFHSHHEATASHREIFSIGPTHVAFTVDDLEVTCLRLQAAGVKLAAPPQTSPDGYAKVTFCYDPDGTPLELVEVLSAPEPAT